jgi:hypothetical protein
MKKTGIIGRKGISLNYESQRKKLKFSQMKSDEDDTQNLTQCYYAVIEPVVVCCNNQYSS